MRSSINSEEIYKRVEKARIEKGWSIYKLSKEANVSLTTVYSWRDKNHFPSLYLIENIAEALNVDIAYLLFNVREDKLLIEEEVDLIEFWRRLNYEQKQNVKIVIELLSKN